jgi:putative sigma-54 modulation protein
MQIHLSPRQVKLTGALHAFIANKVAHLETLTDQILAAHVVLAHEESQGRTSNYCVKLHVAVPGPDIHAEDRDHDLYAAIDKVIAKVARQLRKRKTKLVDKRKKISRREARTRKSAF